MSEPEHHARKPRSGPSSGSFKVARVDVQELAALAGPDGLSGEELLSDELLVDRVLRGQVEHFDTLMRRTGTRLYRIARGILGSQNRAEAQVRDAFVRGYQSLANYDRKLRLGDWLSRIVIHGALASVRLDSAPPRVESGRRPYRDFVRLLEEAVDALPQAFRVAFTLCILDDMSPADAAQALGLTSEAMRTQAFRGRLRVRRQVGMRFDDAEARAFGLELTGAERVIRSVRARLGFT